MAQKKSEVKGPERLLTAKQAAHYLGIGEALFYRKGFIGILHPVNMNGTIRYDMKDLDAFIDSCKVAEVVA